MAKELKNKPLVEAILEIRWQLQQLQGAPSGFLTDPHYKLLLGRLFDRMRKDYPEHEQLPIATFPDEMVGHIVQHRFRVAANSWPLVQVGPGIFTVNSTADYKWGDFRPRVLSAVERLYDAHPKVGDLKINNLILRYIDAVNFDCETGNIFEFLKDKMKLNISLPPNLLDKTDIENRPSGLTLQYSFKCKQPKGNIDLRIAMGQNQSVPAVIWQTTVESEGNDLPGMQEGFEGWLNAAHEITDNWFFKMIEGELERGFSGE